MNLLISIALVLLTLTGCGSMRSSPDSPMSAGGLTPTIEDKEAGLVGLAPNFDVKTYRVIGVKLFPVTDKLEDEGDRQFAATMAAFFNAELVRRLRESGQFQRVVNLAESDYKPAAGEKMLRLEGDITRLGRGSRVARYFAGIYGAGRARAQADMRFVDASTGRVVMVTADRRIAQVAFFGGDDEDLLKESFDDMARDLARFLQRLARGEAPTKTATSEK
jgi:hypothetical protein